MKTLLRKTLLPAMMLLVSCNQVVQYDFDSYQSGILASYPSSGKNFRLSLTDAPNDNLASVFVNIKSVELKFEKDGDISTWEVAKGLGMVDLLTLQNGKLKHLADLSIEKRSSLRQIHIVLENSGHYITYKDGGSCDLITPTSHQAGLKLDIPAVEVEDYSIYSLVVDFDAKKSVMITGSGECILSPKLLVGGYSSIDPQDLDEGSVVGAEQNYTKYEAQEFVEEEAPEAESGLFDCSTVDLNLIDLNDEATWPVGATLSDLSGCID